VLPRNVTRVTANSLIPTVGQGIEIWLTEVVKKTCKPSTIAIYQDIIEKMIYDRTGNLAELAERRLDDVTMADMERLHRTLEKSPYEPNRAPAVVSSFFTWTEKKNWRPKNSDPCLGVAPYAASLRERFLTKKELRRLGRSLRIAEGMKSETIYAIGAIRLILFTGPTSTEIVNLKWSEVDLKKGVLRLTDPKAGVKIIRLNAPAQELLKNLPRIENNEFVFPGRLDRRPLGTLGKSWARIRDQAKLVGVRLHDLRNSFAPLAAGGRASTPLIGQLLGRSSIALKEAPKPPAGNTKKPSADPAEKKRTPSNAGYKKIDPV
jgi:integrase